MARIEKKKHFLSDVAFGAAIGILSGRTVTIGSGEKRFAVSPVATPGGAAINFSLVGNNKHPSRPTFRLARRFVPASFGETRRSAEARRRFG